MNDQDVNAAIKRIAVSKFGKMVSIMVKGIVYIFFTFIIFFLFWAMLDITDVRVIYEEQYPFSDTIQNLLFELNEASSKFIIDDISAFFIAFFITLGIVIGVGIPLLQMKYIENNSEELEYQPRNYLLYLILIAEAMIYAFGYYKFWDMSVAGGYIFVRFLFAYIIFFMANWGIKKFVIGYKLVLAIILNVLSVLCLTFAFMFAFYRFIVIPLIIYIVGKLIQEIADNAIFIFWI